MDKIELIFWMDFGIFEWVQTEIVNCGYEVVCRYARPKQRAVLSSMLVGTGNKATFQFDGN